MLNLFKLIKMKSLIPAVVFVLLIITCTKGIYMLFNIAGFPCEMEIFRSLSAILNE